GVVACHTETVWINGIPNVPSRITPVANRDGRIGAGDVIALRDRLGGVVVTEVDIGGPVRDMGQPAGVIPVPINWRGLPIIVPFVVAFTATCIVVESLCLSLARAETVWLVAQIPDRVAAPIVGVFVASVRKQHLGRFPHQVITKNRALVFGAAPVSVPVRGHGIKLFHRAPAVGQVCDVVALVDKGLVLAKRVVVVPMLAAAVGESHVGLVPGGIVKCLGGSRHR